MVINKISVLKNKYNSCFYMVFLIFALTTVYLLDNFVFGPIIGGFIGNYLLVFLIWAFLALATYFFPSVSTVGRLRHRELIYLLALICAVISILVTALQGFVVGFGKSPYDRSLIGIVINFLTLGVVLVATELTRSWIINRYFRNRLLVGIPVVALFYTVIAIPFSQLANIKTIKQAVEFFGSTFLPGFMESFLTTYLAALGGPMPAIIYQVIPVIAERISPILPNSPWVMTALFGTIAPVLGMILVYEIYQYESRQARRTTAQEGGMLGWFTTAVASVLLIWFALGVFSIFPRVVITGSMVPVINIGDVVIIKEISPEEVELGDIILFPMGNTQVVHRVIEIKEQGNQKVFITKGDANCVPDADPVLPANVMGEVIFIIPKAGWVTLLLKGD